MFRFNFGGDLLENDEDSQMLAVEQPSDTQVAPPQPASSSYQPENCVEIPLNELLSTLPSRISASSLKIVSANPSSTPKEIILPRRDLYDVRFQLISQEDGSESDEDEEVDEGGVRGQSGKQKAGIGFTNFVDAPSDVVPNAYEGGLKTWECSVDLVSYLASLENFDPQGLAALEIGCGTAIPTSYLLSQCLTRTTLPAGTIQKTEFHLQDYNRAVLELVTVPNLLLTWCTWKSKPNNSPDRPTHTSTSLDYTSESASYRDSQIPPLPTPRPDEPLELVITPDLINAFQLSLNQHNILIHLYSGSWTDFRPLSRTTPDRKFDVILTSETIYRPESVSPLLDVLRFASLTQEQESRADGIEQLMKNVSIRECRILIAAKVLYFGVGGSTDEFIAQVESEGGRIKTVWESTAGVGRQILQMAWS